MKRFASRERTTASGHLLSQRMRILHITTFLQGGAGRNITDLAIAQSHAGHDVLVATDAGGVLVSVFTGGVMVAIGAFLVTMLGGKVRSA